MTTQLNNSTVFATDYPDVAKRVSVVNLFLSLLIAVAGIASFVAVFAMDDRSSTVSMALMVLGTSLVLIALFRLFWKSREVVYLPTGSVTRERSLFFDLRYLDRLTDLIEQGRLNAEAAVKSVSSGNVRLDVLIARDGNFAALQLFQFVPYTYTPVTSVHYCTGHEAAAVAAFLSKCA